MYEEGYGIPRLHKRSAQDWAGPCRRYASGTLTKTVSLSYETYDVMGVVTDYGAYM